MTDHAVRPWEEVQAYLDHIAHEKRLAARTCALYRWHLLDLQARIEAEGLKLETVLPAHVRRWVAQLHAQGRNGRGISLVLSLSLIHISEPTRH